MRLRAILMRWLRGDASDDPVRLWAFTPTVTREETAKLGPRWLEPDLPTAVPHIPVTEDDLPLAGLEDSGPIG